MIIAIDGTTASGKGTLAKRLAGHFGLPAMDTGLLYRAVGARCRREGVALDDPLAAAEAASGLDLTDFDEAELRTAIAGADASVVAAHGPVRAALLDVQRAFAARPGGAILDGRDIGTVVCPHATHKFWVDADLSVRAARRARELAGQGQPVDIDALAAQIAARDARDRSRPDAPALAAPDAIRLDTTHLDVNGMVAAAIAAIEGMQG